VPGDAVPDLHYAQLADLTPRELISWTPLAGLTLVAGLWPAVILALADPAIHNLLGGAR
jgi:NADH-quinone oxidoreductase subunit M